MKFDFFASSDIISLMKNFYEQVYDVVEKIPYGRVTTFGQIAHMIGRPKMARFVGYAFFVRRTLF